MAQYFPGGGCSLIQYRGVVVSYFPIEPRSICFITVNRDLGNEIIGK